MVRDSGAERTGKHRALRRLRQLQDRPERRASEVPEVIQTIFYTRASRRAVWL